MHVEVNVALNFLISYLYNKLPRRRVNLFGEELEKGLKKKFEGHWYPDKPFKGSAFRCVRFHGDTMDPVVISAVQSAGLDLQEVLNCIPEEMTLWIDPSEVAYRLGERSPVKVLYTDRHEDEGCDTMDREVQAANHTFNPEALSFQPIDSLSSSLSNLSLSPSSPVPPGTWSNSISPSSALYSSPTQSTQPPPTAPVFMGKASATPQFTAASFAATKFGSTKLKSQAKRPTRLSPTELGNYFRQQQRSDFTTSLSPQRPQSLSPRDPRLEFLMDQQQRFYPRDQLSPQGHLYNASRSLQQHQKLQQQQQQMSFPMSAVHNPLSPNNNPPLFLGDWRGYPSHHGPQLGMTAFPDMSPVAHTAMQSPVNSLSPDGHKSFPEDLQQLSNMHNNPSHLQHLLVAN